MKKLRKTASFTDIHFGCKSNSEQHNQDCLNYIDWFCQNVKLNKADNIIFLGDWYENRSALNVSTLHYSYLGAKKLNELGIPIFFIIGNHDLYHRHTREIYSPIHFHEFSNFRVIDQPTIISEIQTSPLLCPYLFPSEYPELCKYNNVETWWGHFEFKGFVVTGHTLTMKTGPEHQLFDGPKYIFSGHFHKRQRGDNVIYIGNTFPTNFSDADDNDRGMMIYNHDTQETTFYNWDDCPKYSKVTLTDLMDNDIKLLPGSRVKCITNTPITFEESTTLKHEIVKLYNLREFIFEEMSDVLDAISGTETDVTVEDVDITSIHNIDNVVVQLLQSIDVDTIDNNILVDQYRKL